jgi:hypothetical protein
MMFRYLQEVISKKKIFCNKFFVGILGRSMMKIAGSASGSGSISQRYGSGDPQILLSPNKMVRKTFIPTAL